MIKSLVAFVCAFVLSVILMPVIIKFFRKKQASQTILGYVENHKEKNGTLTMGGVVFMTTTLVLSFCFLKYNHTWFVVLLVSVFYGILGLMDDYLKIKFKQNLGLRAYQKVVGQVGIALIFGIFVFFSSQGGQIFLPFTDKMLDIGFWIVPLIVIVLVATTNSVNLTDGLDGLAGNVSVVYLIFFFLISTLLHNTLFTAGETGNILQSLNDVNVLTMLFVGAILGFLMFNTNRATIFMGDAGSLCLGGFIGASACAIGQELLIPLLGFCFVFSAISVILQVFSFKTTRKRIFKMAPFHHHLQMSGLREPKIVAIYSAVTGVIGVICVIFYLI